MSLPLPSVCLGALICMVGALKSIAASGTNDMFAGRDYVEGTNWTYAGNVSVATREADEPQPSWLNTVWMSWLAPITGRVYLYGIHDPPHDYAVYTGSTLATLQPAPLAGVSGGLRTLLIQQGVQYHFQFTGGPEDFALALYQLNPFVHATNDNFIEAQCIKGEGNGTFADPKSFSDAGMEPGEPLHLGAVPQRSLWYVWQAPRYGNLNVILGYNLLTNGVALAAYQGPAVDSLTLVGKGTNSLRVPVVAGETYYVAAAVPEFVTGDIVPSFMLSQASSMARPVPGNLLGNPSFEGGETNGRDWSASGELGGYLNSPGGGGADGSHWPYLPTHVKIWQDIPTIPGHLYRIRFAFRLGAVSCCGIGGVRVLWNENDIGTSYNPEGEEFWHWSEYFTIASSTTTRVTWTNLHVNLEMDAFSVIDMNAQPLITRELVSVNTLNGGTATFSVDSLGTRPLFYQWLFNGEPLVATNGPILTLRAVNPAAAGNYSVIITNNYGAVTSLTATLSVESPTNATILVQPYGDIVPAGGYYNLSVAAVGLPPLRYQWLLNGASIADATNRNLTFTNAGAADAGKYEVLVQNDFSSVYSLPAILVVTNPTSGGALLEFRNRSTGVAAPVYDVDGTPLAGDTFVAQLYAGMTVEGLRAASAPIGFRTSATLQGYFIGSAVTLPNIPGGIDMFAQIRVWESAFGSSYEEARARGGKFGKSLVLQLHPNPPPAPPMPLFGLQSFALQAGLAQFSVGTIEFVKRQPGGIVIWSLQGEPGFRYVVEKSMHPHDPVWRPYIVLTNMTGMAIFSDSANSASSAVLYRSRILD